MTKEVLGGYNGKILRINLSDKKVIVELKDDKFYRKNLGGSGFISYFLFNELKAGIDPLGPENKLIFALGPTTGTSVIGSGRNAVGAKSPLTGGIALSHVGEFWGAELKKAGFDAIIVEGKSDKPVYISIQDSDVSIRDADHLWGMNTKETQQTIRMELGDEKIRAALIGPAGENQVLYACIMNGLFDAAGRGGMGAVMGSKNLKAVVVRGHQTPQVVDPEGLKALNKWIVNDKLYDFWLPGIIKEYGTGGPEIEGFEEVGHLPVNNWRGGEFPGIQNIHGGAIKDKLKVGMDGCFACPLRCKKACQSNEPYFIDPAYGGPEYEAMSALGSNCGVDNLEVMVKANELCNAYSLDVISTGGVISFAMECFENGLLSLEETDGIDLRFGNGEAMLKCIELIAQREGFGNFLAEGSARLAKKIGKEAEQYTVEVKGVDPGQHEPRLNPAFALGLMINPHGADHCCNAHDDAFAVEEGMKNYRSLGYLDTVPMYDIGPRKVALFKVEHLRQVLFDSLMLCHLAYINFDYKTITDIVAKVTGWDTDVTELMRSAERILTMARLFNIREGFTADDDRLPIRFYETKIDGPRVEALDPVKMEKAKKYYYTLMGWDEKGVPLPEKVEELYIS